MKTNNPIAVSPRSLSIAILKFFFCSLMLGAWSLAWAQGDPVHGGTPTEKFVLQAGDQLQISYPGAPDLDRSLTVRRDGVATFPIIGEVLASGKTPRELEAILLKLYADELVTNEVVVTVANSTFTYFLEGEIRGPGMIQSARQLSVLEAIIAGGGIVKETGKLKDVVVIRRPGLPPTAQCLAEAGGSRYR
jgi:polysaccharide export outer membrane protein